MTEDEFNRTLDEHLFRDIALLPVIVSLSDPRRHFHVPGQGVFMFEFDKERRLVAWRAWDEVGDGAYENASGGLQARVTVAFDPGREGK